MSQRSPPVAVAIDRDKGSQGALKWALDNIISRGQTVSLVHVSTNKAPYLELTEDSANAMKELFYPFTIFCKRKEVISKEIILEGTDVARAIIEYVSQQAIGKLVVGAPSRGFMRFKMTDVSTTVSRLAPDFCSVFVVSKGKVSSVRKAVREAPDVSPSTARIRNQASMKQECAEQLVPNAKKDEVQETRFMNSESDTIRSPFNRASHFLAPPTPSRGMSSESDISFVSTRSSDHYYPQRLSVMSDSFDQSFEMTQISTSNGFSSTSLGSCLSQTMTEDIEAEMRRLRLELKQTMDMYSTACKEALMAKQKAMELNQWKTEEAQRLQETRLAGEAALAMVERERAKCKVAMEATEASQRIAELEARRCKNVELKALQEAVERKKTMPTSGQSCVRYRKYSIEDIKAATESFSETLKIGEGGYGPVYKCFLDHTPVAVKALRPDANQGKAQFQQEVEILSCIRHPNMVLLLGACPEFGCLVYEYMANGSLEDRLLRRGNTPPLPWQHRFRIAAEIGTGLLFLHQTKPEPLVHRDLKPANILLDQNFVSKISDVGLARLVPPSIADSVTQYRMTCAAGTFCYIDPEYQQSGLLGTKSDIYSLGVILLQLISGRAAMGLTHHVERSIEKGTFKEVLDPTVPDWPVEEAFRLAQLALKCSELRRKDRPDLANVVLPELNRLRELARRNMQYCVAMGGRSGTVSMSSHASNSQVSMEYSMSSYVNTQSGYESSGA